MPELPRCYFIKNKNKLIIIKKKVYKEFFAHLKEVEMNPSETDNKIKNPL